jgi:secondary thiamine-phosphate synthase enzyme
VGNSIVKIMTKVVVNTNKSRCVVDITDLITGVIDDKSKAVSVFTAHTTCAITTADLDPGTDQDLLDAVYEIVPKLEYRHPHDSSHKHVHSHLASSLIGPGVTVPVKDGKLELGAWQKVVLVELDGPRQRTVIITDL